MLEIFESFKDQATWMMMCLIMMVIAMALDLLTGIIKAKRHNVATTSTGLKRTCDKAMKYFLPTFACACMDVLLSFVCEYPFMTIAYSLFCISIEVKSVFENTHTKDEIKDTAKALALAVTNQDDKKKLMLEITKQLFGEENIPKDIVVSDDGYYDVNVEEMGHDYSTYEVDDIYDNDEEIKPKNKKRNNKKQNY